MRPLILYRLHSSEQLVEGTCLFDFSITYFIAPAHHEWYVNVSCEARMGRYGGISAAPDWFLLVTISALGQLVAMESVVVERCSFSQHV